jgi:hypothetical protein
MSGGTSAAAADAGPYTVDINMPTWGEDSATEAIRDDGSRVRLAPGESAPPAGVARIELCGYAITPTHPTPGALLLPVATRPQPTDPHPGPTLSIRLVAGARFSAASLGLRLAPGGA